jgi:flagellar biosynthetic protein FliR
MDWVASIAVAQFLTFTLVAARLSGLAIVAPLFGAPEVPATVRAFFTIGLALLVTPVLGETPGAWPASLGAYVWVAAGELALGFVLGFGAQLLFVGVQMGGQLVAQQAAMSFGSVVNPQFDAEISVIDQFYYLVALAIFLIIGGHRLLLEALLETYVVFPPGGVELTSEMVDTLVSLAGQSLSIAVRVGAPAVVALQLAGLAMGIMSRTVPQINILVIGFTLRTASALLFLAVSLAGFGLLVEDQVPVVIDQLREAVGLAAR